MSNTTETTNIGLITQLIVSSLIITSGWILLNPSINNTEQLSAHLYLIAHLIFNIFIHLLIEKRTESTQRKIITTIMIVAISSAVMTITFTSAYSNHTKRPITGLYAFTLGHPIPNLDHHADFTRVLNDNNLGHNTAHFQSKTVPSTYVRLHLDDNNLVHTITATINVLAAHPTPLSFTEEARIKSKAFLHLRDIIDNTYGHKDTPLFKLTKFDGFNGLHIEEKEECCIRLTVKMLKKDRPKTKQSINAEDTIMNFEKQVTQDIFL